MSPVIRVLLKVTRFLQQSGHFDPCTTVVRVATEFTVPFSSMLWLRLVAASPHPTYVALGGSNTAGTHRVVYSLGAACRAIPAGLPVPWL